jgi:hypothetical protein
MSPAVVQVILNLSTQINRLSFSPSGEMLAISSEMKVSVLLTTLVLTEMKTLLYVFHTFLLSLHIRPSNTTYMINIMLQGQRCEAGSFPLDDGLLQLSRQLQHEQDQQHRLEPRQRLPFIR